MASGSRGQTARSLFRSGSSGNAAYGPDSTTVLYLSIGKK